MDAKPSHHWLAKTSRGLCLAVLMLLVALYFGIYYMLLDDVAIDMSDSTTDNPLMYRPLPAYGDKYKLGGEGVRSVLLAGEPAASVH